VPFSSGSYCESVEDVDRALNTWPCEATAPGPNGGRQISNFASSFEVVHNDHTNPATPCLAAGNLAKPSHLLFRKNIGDGDYSAMTVKAVVLAIRGTGSASDVLTDALRYCVPLADAIKRVAERTGLEPASPAEARRSKWGVLGCDTSSEKCHAGMMDAAEWLCIKWLKELQRYSDEGYEVYTTGHSLGAGTSALLCILLRAFGVQAQAVGIGPPPVCTRALAEAATPYVTSLVSAEDIVPRASVVSDDFCEIVAILLPACRCSNPPILAPATATTTVASTTFRC
jgi:hypothetical protein